MLLSWELWALIASMAMAAYIEANRFFKMDGLTIVVLRSALCFLALLPVVFLLPWPNEPGFYILTLMVGALTMLADVLLFEAVAKFGGRLGSLYKPLKIWFIFVMWLLLSPATAQHFVQEPLLALAVGVCLLLCSSGLWVLRQCDASMRAILFMIPVAFAFAAADLGIAVSKVFVTALPTLIIFVFLYLGVQAVIGSAVLMVYKKDYFIAILKERWVWQQMAIMAALTLVVTHSVSAALMSAPNPSYVTAIGLLSVVWLQIYHKLVKTPEETSPLAAVLFVVGACGLALLE